MLQSGERLVPWSVGGFGLVTGVGVVAIRAVSSVGQPRAATLVLGLAFTVALVATGAWLDHRQFGRDVWRVTGWTYGGAALLVSVEMVLHLAEGHRAPFASFVGIFLVNAAAGALAGTIIGVLTVQTRRDARKAALARKRFRFLNSLLRHDVLNGMTVIGGHVEALERTDVDEDVVSTIRRRVDAMTDLVQNVRVASRTFAGDSTRESVELAPVVRRQATLLGDSYEVDIDVSVPRDVTVLADDALSAVFNNLLTNAVEHSDRRVPTVSVDTAVDDETVVVTVADDGPGVPDDEKATIFEKDPDRPNHGIGLFIVESLLEFYEGDVWVTDNDPRGARFHVELQRA